MIDQYLASPGQKRLELGAGATRRPGWLCTDIDTLDVTKPFPVPDNSFDFIYSEHMIEHLTFEQGFHMLQECYRVLKPGGVLRIATPSIEFLFKVWSGAALQYREYINWSVRAFLPLAPKDAPQRALMFNNFMRAWGHTFIYDNLTLLWVFHTTGFIDTKLCKINLSAHAELCHLESTQRMPPGFLELESMIFEGIKDHALT